MKAARSPIKSAAANDPFSGAPTFTLRHRSERAAFAVVWALAARWTPPPMRAWRNWILRCFGANLHVTANVYGSASIWYPPNLLMAAHATLGPKTNCYCMAPITLGERAVVSKGAHLCAGSHDIDDPHFQLIAKPISIGAKAWIAAESFVGPGVTVGSGAVLGARAVTVKNLDEWTVYAGNPAKVVRTRRREGDAP